MEWLPQNWFSVFVAIGMVLSTAINYGITTAKGKAVADKVDELETTLIEVEKTMQLHCSNSDIHVSTTLLQLFNERSDFMKLQMSEMRLDMQRIESAVTK